MPVRSSTCNIPSTASAYSLNYTVVPRATLWIPQHLAQRLTYARSLDAQ